ncbi:MAG TPA: hypothetical protein VJX74_05655 [Blastocatellia bacterium]|nr:hypothetical protein [Blastocatellia bacterium]
MSSVSQLTVPVDLKRAEYLKHELMKFATTGALKDEYDRQHKLLFELATEVDEREVESMLDWFLFDWFDPNGEGVIDYFLDSHKDLSKEDQDILLDWQDSIDSVFEIRSLSKNTLRLKELDEDGDFNVVTSTPLDETPFKRKQFIAARLLPLGDHFIFSGLQFIMPDRQSALEALEMRRALEALDSPEAMENAQREQCSAFCELFGCDEMTVPSGELNSTLQRFQQYVFAERRDPESGLTPAERFKTEFGRELNVPEMPPLPEILSNAGNVTILCDDFDGIVLLPDFNRFKQVFESKNPDKAVPDWQELMWNYVKDPDIPIVAFERIAEQFPERVEAVMRKLIGDKDFSLEHLYAVLLHYKQPMEGFDDMQDEQNLWDLFNGNAKPAQAKSKSQAKAKAKKSTGKATAKSKKKTTSKAAVASKPRAAKKATTSKGRASAKKR